MQTILEQINDYTITGSVALRFKNDPEWFTRRRETLTFICDRNSKVWLSEEYGAGLFTLETDENDWYERRWIGFRNNDEDSFAQFLKTLEIDDKFSIECVNVTGYFVPLSADKVGKQEPHSCNCNRCFR